MSILSNITRPDNNTTLERPSANQPAVVLGPIVGGLLLEYLSESERLNSLNYSQDLIQDAIQGLEAIHKAFVHHRDIYPKHMLVIPGGKIVWVGFDVVTHFSDMGALERAYCEYELELVESFGKLLVCSICLP